MRPKKKTPMLLGSLVALAACASDPPGRDEDATLETMPHAVVGASVLPNAGATEYATFGKMRTDAILVRTPDNDVALSYEGRKGATVVKGGLRNKAQPDTLVLAGGKPSVRADLPTGMVDLLELLPPASTKLIVGEPYLSPPPDEDYILQQADQDRMVLWQQMTNTPTEVVEGTGYTLVRVENRAMNRVYLIDDDGTITSSDMGEAYLGVTDLVKVGGAWEVLRFVRFADVAGADELPGLALDDARGRAHGAFVVCATRMDNLGPSTLRQALHQLAGNTPELAMCAAH